MSAVRRAEAGTWELEAPVALLPCAESVQATQGTGPGSGEVGGEKSVVVSESSRRSLPLLSASTDSSHRQNSARAPHLGPSTRAPIPPPFLCHVSRGAVPPFLRFLLLSPQAASILGHRPRLVRTLAALRPNLHSSADRFRVPASALDARRKPRAVLIPTSGLPLVSPRPRPSRPAYPPDSSAWLHTLLASRLSVTNKPATTRDAPARHHTTSRARSPFSRPRQELVTDSRPFLVGFTLDQ